jgi:hypothetical protein
MSDEASATASKAVAWLVVAVLTAIVAIIVVTLSFSTVNTPTSVDGDKAQYSHNLDSGK